MRSLLVLLTLLSVITLKAQTNPTFSKYVGKYEINGFAVQIVFHDTSIALVIPGAPLQEMKPLGENRFKSIAYDDSFFLFVEREGKVVAMVSMGQGNSMELTKVSDIADAPNRVDSLLTLKKSTGHFIFLYSEIDSVNIDHMGRRLEKSYHTILKDFKLKELPTITVRVYPTLKSFHVGINFPEAPSNVLATAFGKDDIRMVSSQDTGVEDSTLLMNHVVHEFVHCVHLNIDYAPNNPRWLWEGVAMYESGWFIDPKEIDIIKRRNFPSLSALGNGLEYELGYVIIEAISEIWGFEKVIGLIKKRGDTQAVLQINQEAFEKKIFDFVYRKYVTE